MNNEAKLLSKVIEDRSVGFILERGVNEEWFADPSDKKLFRFIHDHYSKYQECPSLSVITDNFPTYQLLYVEDTIDYFLDRLVDNRRKLSIIHTIGDALTSIEKDKDHEGALIAMERGLVRLEEEGLTRSNDLEITKEASNVLLEYEYRKNNPGMLGLATGFPTIDASTSGLQPEQLVVIVAPPKTGKSTLALQIAINCHLNGSVPMFMSFEMSNTEQKNRYYCMRARISYQRFMTGNLTSDEEGRLIKVVAEGVPLMRDKFWFVDSTGGQTVSAVASKIQSKNPDIVFIDGTYLMIDEQTGESNTPQAITNITRSLKRLAQKIKKPIVISTQALAWKMRGGQVTTDSIGYSSSFHQDADVIFGLQRVDENVDDTRTLRVIASRNSGLSEANLLWDWNTGAFRELSEEDLAL
jgi:replicative DNA helicase